MKVLSIDFETTNKINWSLPLADGRQPRPVEIGAVLLANGNTVNTISLIVRPISWTISAEVSQIHGITQEMALDVGVQEDAALFVLLDLMLRADVLVAHNLNFDSGMLVGMAARHNQVLPDVPGFCTMLAMMDHCRLPGGRNGEYKWPRLEEAHAHCFPDREPLHGHSALVDAQACAEIHQWLSRAAEKFRKQNKSSSLGKQAGSSPNKSGLH